MFTKRLKELLKDNKISQITLANKLHISKNQIHYWVKGKSEPSIQLLIDLANYFNVTIDYLVGRVDY